MIKGIIPCIILLILSLFPAILYAQDSESEPAAETIAEGKPLSGLTLNEGWSNPISMHYPLNVQGGWTDAVVATEDGKNLYFSYSRTDFGQYFDSNGRDMEVTGPGRQNLKSENARLFHAEKTDTGWAVTYHPSNLIDNDVDEASQTSPAISPDGRSMLYTLWNYREKPDADIYISTIINKQWMARPSAVIELNSGCDDDHAHIIPSQTKKWTIYFESKRYDPLGQKCTPYKRLFFTEYDGKKFDEIKPVPGLEREAKVNDSQPFVTQDGKEIYWIGVRNKIYGIYKAERQEDGSFGNIRPIIIPTMSPPYKDQVVLVGDPSVTKEADGSKLYFTCGIASDEKQGKPIKIALKICRVEMPASPQVMEP